MTEPTCDLLWLTGLAAELSGEMSDRTLRLWRHSERPLCWLDAGGTRSWVADLTSGGSHLRTERPEETALWRRWGGKRTENAHVTGLSVLGGDRVLAVHLRWRSRLGDDERTDLILELGGRRTNAVLVSAEGTVIDVLRPVSRRVNRVREVLPGRSYQPPPALGRQRVDMPWRWEETSDAALAEYLSRSFLAMSGRWAEELCARCGLDAAMPVRAVSEEQRHALERQAAAMLREPSPCVLLDEAGRPFDHTAFRPLLVPPEQVRPARSFAEAIEAVWSEHRSDAASEREATLRVALFRKERRRLERRRERLLADLSRAEQADDLAHLADLLMAHLKSIPPGAREAAVTDWFDPEQPEVVVRLNPTQSPAHQAEQLYRRARKLRDSIPHLRTRLARTERALKDLERTTEDSSAPHRETERSVAATRKERSSSHQPSDRIRPRRYRTRDGGWLVLVGRTERENDALSLKLAAANDLWFHAHGCPGSHVVLKLEGRKEMPSRQALSEAAGLAAYWSKARGASKVGVSYTRAKYVTKPKGAKPGTVTIRHEKLLMVPPSLLPLADAEPSEEPVEAEG